MFKRRRDEPGQGPEIDPGFSTQPAAEGQPPSGLFPPHPPEPPQAAAPPAAAAPGEPQADTGLGMPPFRPVPSKEPPSMARSPFNTPSPSPNQPPPGPQPGIPPRPAGPPMPPSSPGLQPGGMQPGGPQQPGARPDPSRPPNPAPGAERRTLVVGRGISLQGLIQDAERLVVEGTVEAQLLHANELAVSPGGVFKGEVEVEDAEIAGIIDGAVTARGNLIVRGTGKVIGTARCRRLQVEDGGQISGTIEMLAEAPQRGPDRAG